MESFRRVFDVNTTGTFNVMRFAVAAMLKNAPTASSDGQRGVIINTSSIAAADGLTNNVAYSASKAAVSGMTQPLARELGRYGIRVMAIKPGAFNTPMTADKRAQEALKELVPTIVFPKRCGDPKEFAQLVWAIIQNPYLNGEEIRLDGGIRAYSQ